MRRPLRRAKPTSSPGSRARRRAPSRACSSARSRRAPAARWQTMRSSRRTSSRFWSGVFPKPMPGSRQTRSSGMPCATASSRRSSRKAITSDDHVVVLRGRLHRPRLALHVHETEIRTRIGDHAGQLRVAPQRGHVIHQHGPELERTPRDRGLRRVDRDGKRLRALRGPARPGRAPPPPRRLARQAASTRRPRRRARRPPPRVAARARSRRPAARTFLRRRNCPA